MGIAAQNLGHFDEKHKLLMPLGIMMKKTRKHAFGHFDEGNGKHALGQFERRNTKGYP